MNLSVVTVIKNRKQYVDKFVNNVVDQSVPKIEHFVIDGASTDGTIDQLKKHRHLNVISKSDNGSVFALNTGLKLISGDVFCWLNSDEQYHDGVLNYIVEAFKSNPEADVISGGYDIVGPTGVLIKRSYGKNYSAKNRMIGYNSLVPSCVFIKTTALKAVGCYVDETLMHCYDHELYTRLRANCTWLHIQKIFSRFEVHAGSGVISNPSLAISENRRLRERYRRGFNGAEFLARCLFFDNYVRLHLILRWRHTQKKARNS